jgi:hypothetical protein
LRHPARGFGSPGNLPSEEINGYPNLRMQKGDLFSIKERAAAKRLSISFVSVQSFPHRFTEDAINFDGHASRLFEDSRIPVLDEEKTSQYAMDMKP